MHFREVILRSGSSRALRIAVLALFICSIVWNSFHSQYSRPLNVRHTCRPLPVSAEHNLTRPENRSIAGLVFYGRSDRVSILNCYLERNLRNHGGWLDEVHFIRNTDNATDLAYLDEIVEANIRYQTIELSTPITEHNDNQRYREAWSKLHRDTIYVKIDDDIVWLTDDAIPRMVTRKLRQDDYILVSASVINSPLMSEIHYTSGAYHAYLHAHVPSMPQKVFARLHNSKARRYASWEYTSYPVWSGPDNLTVSHHDDELPVDLDSTISLRLPASQQDLSRTPISGIEYSSWGSGWSSSLIAIQSHLSLLENLHDHTLNLYYNGLGEVHFTHPYRLSINVIVVWSNDILDALNSPEFGNFEDDEEWLTVTLPSMLEKRVAVETRALASHFSFGAQKGVESTDLLERYRSYANERACLSAGGAG